ncbi:conserved oligomeric Golgi complex subunit 4-like [Sycon ciliatum]|uniref:conserved oligomeric Golgi complex subunit 4-like n=1 Tax=Sycon ciliatum TaxID=27933 RepID=UPI0031F6D0DE
MEQDVLSLTSLDDIKKMYDAIEQEQQKAMRDLRNLLGSRAQVDVQMTKLQKIIPNLSSLVDDSEKLCSSISNTCKLADSVSSKVRQLDLAKGRVQQAIQRTNDITDLKKCVDGVETALYQEDYETAAGHVHRYLTLDKSILKEATLDSGGVDSAILKLSQAEDQLKRIVHEKFDKAVESESPKDVERFFKIFPLLNLKEEGLEKFGKYLCNQIKRNSAENLATAMETPKTKEGADKRSDVIYADTVTLLFETIARLLEEHRPQVETFYGPANVFPLLKVLQHECDAQANKIFKQFIEDRAVDAKLQQVRMAMHPTKATTVEQRPDPLKFDALLAEMTLLPARSELYFTFMRRQGEDESGGESGVDAINQLLTESNLSRLVQEVVQHYTSLEDFFMRESIGKALKLDTVPNGSLFSSMVDEVFFVLRKAIRRAVTTCDVGGVCAILHHAGSLLSTDFYEIIEGKLRTGFPSGSIDFSGVLQGHISSTVQTVQSSFQSSSDAAAARAAFLVTLNNTSAAIDNIKKLVQDVESECSKLSRDMRSGTKIQTCLDELSQCTKVFQQLLEDGRGRLAASLSPRMKPLVDEFASFSHQPTEDEFTMYEAHDEFVEQLVHGLESLFHSVKPNLTGDNFGNAVSLMVTELTHQLERAVKKSAFNQLGGLHFDKQLRALVAYLSTVTQWTIRDKFSKLTQIATILNFERPAEIEDYWGRNAGPVTWLLSPPEVKDIMALRKDFRTDDINRLKL